MHRVWWPFDLSSLNFSTVINPSNYTGKYLVAQGITSKIRAGSGISDSQQAVKKKIRVNIVKLNAKRMGVISAIRFVIRFDYVLFKIGG
jgi:hypothetical protein